MLWLSDLSDATFPFIHFRFQLLFVLFLEKPTQMRQYIVNIYAEKRFYENISTNQECVTFGCGFVARFRHNNVVFLLSHVTSDRLHVRLSRIFNSGHEKCAYPKSVETRAFFSRGQSVRLLMVKLFFFALSTCAPFHSQSLLLLLFNMILFSHVLFFSKFL